MFARLNHFKKPQNVNYLARFQTTPASQTWEFKEHLQISTHQLFPIFGIWQQHFGQLWQTWAP